MQKCLMQQGTPMPEDAQVLTNKGWVATRDLRDDMKALLFFTQDAARQILGSVRFPEVSIEEVV